MLLHGSVVTWAQCDMGGDSRAVWGQLENLKHIQATKYAFAAILDELIAVVTFVLCSNS